MDENGSLYPLTVGSAVITEYCASDSYIKATCNVNVVASSGASVTWQSSNERIATVDETGLVTDNGTLGSVNITATSTGGSKISGRVTIIVK